MPIQLDQYEQNSISDLTACFNQRVQEIICRTACNKLNEEKQIILSEKDTFFSKLLGKTELKQAKIKNLEAKIKYITKKRDTSTTADVKEMLKEIHECANTYNNGKLTYEMLEIEELIKDIFTYIPNKDNSSEELNDNSENILPTIRKKSIFSWTKNRREASRLNNETLQIEQDTKNIKEPQPIKSNINSQLTNIYGQYSLTLEKVRRTIECR